MKKSIVVDLIVLLLISLFLYTGFSKYFDFENFSVAMHNQPFPGWFSAVLLWMLPSVEIMVAGMLMFGKTQKIGLLVSAIIMLLFTLYTGSILLHLFPQVPCSCGGVIKSFTWRGHLFFNLFFLMISVTGCVLTINKKQIKNISRAKSG